MELCKARNLVIGNVVKTKMGYDVEIISKKEFIPIFDKHSTMWITGRRTDTDDEVKFNHKMITGLVRKVNDK